MRPLAAVLALAAALSACSSGGGSDAYVRRLPDARLSTLAGIPGPSLATCPTDKCLTVLVAPWCAICRRETPVIIALRKALDRAGVASRIVVGSSDDLPAIRKFAAEFGPDALLDDGGALRSRGVPAFLVTDRKGRILKAVNGFPSGAGPDELARYLDLI
ncbi:MAG: TlpA disulfide reductase family protein [Elusimicrobiota bacterium]